MDTRDVSQSVSRSIGGNIFWRPITLPYPSEMEHFSCCCCSFVWHQFLGMEFACVHILIEWRIEWSFCESKCLCKFLRNWCNSNFYFDEFRCSSLWLTSICVVMCCVISPLCVSVASQIEFIRFAENVNKPIVPGIELYILTLAGEHWNGLNSKIRTKLLSPQYSDDQYHHIFVASAIESECDAAPTLGQCEGIQNFNESIVHDTILLYLS